MKESINTSSSLKEFEVSGEKFRYTELIQDLADGITKGQFKSKYSQYIYKKNKSIFLIGCPDTIEIYGDISGDENEIINTFYYYNPDTLEEFVDWTKNIIDDNITVLDGVFVYISNEYRNELFSALHFLANPSSEQPPRK